MNSPAQTRSEYRDPVSLQVRPDPFARPDGRPRRAPSLMRRYEAAALMPDLSVRHETITAPAMPAFEEATAAIARGTLLQTVSGMVAVEDLLPGDYIETSRGSEAIVWIGSTNYVPNVESDETALTGLTRIVTDGFGPARPSADVIVGPGARMVVECAALKTYIGQARVLVPVSDFVDGDRLLSITPGGAVALYHIATQRHCTIPVAGIEIETFHPGTTAKRQLGETLGERFMKLFPNRSGFEAFGELSLPRTTREVLDSLRSR